MVEWSGAESRKTGAAKRRPLRNKGKNQLPNNENNNNNKKGAVRKFAWFHQPVTRKSADDGPAMNCMKQRGMNENGFSFVFVTCTSSLNFWATTTMNVEYTCTRVRVCED